MYGRGRAEHCDDYDEDLVVQPDADWPVGAVQCAICPEYDRKKNGASGAGGSFVNLSGGKLS